jgi:hypothetical protein
VSAAIVELRPKRLEVPAVIAGNVNLLHFSEAIARAGLVGRHDADRGVLVIEEAQGRLQVYRDCGGTAREDDGACELRGGTGRT